MFTSVSIDDYPEAVGCESIAVYLQDSAERGTCTGRAKSNSCWRDQGRWVIVVIKLVRADLAVIVIGSELGEDKNLLGARRAFPVDDGLLEVRTGHNVVQSVALHHQLSYW